MYDGDFSFIVRPPLKEVKSGKDDTSVGLLNLLKFLYESCCDGRHGPDCFMRATSKYQNDIGSPFNTFFSFFTGTSSLLNSAAVKYS